MHSKGHSQLRPGDLVEVRPAREILMTLDNDGALDAVPFMPEMLPYIGRRFRVAQRAEKICDLVGPGGSRRMRDTVFLENLRCDGSGHGGCQAECRFYWKEAWLQRITDDTPEAEAETDSRDQLATVAETASRPREWDGTSDSYRCQATEAFRATEPLPGRDPRQYVREVRSGNVGLLRLLRVLTRAAWWSLARRLRIRSDLPVENKAPGLERGPERLDLMPGDWVEVRSPEEIGRTLDANGFNRGLAFVPEMLVWTGRRARVARRVERVISERTGEMLHFKNDCIVLEGIYCTAERSPGRWFCPRHAPVFWREAWLKRIEPQSTRRSRGGRSGVSSASARPGRRPHPA